MLLPLPANGDSNLRPLASFFDAPLFTSFRFLANDRSLLRSQHIDWRRYRAIQLLLTRLVLRAGDIVVLQLTDINWYEAGFRFAKKGRRDTRLTLTQEVGDAILTYLQRRGTRPGVDVLSLSTQAPMDRPLSSVAISTVPV